MNNSDMELEFAAHVLVVLGETAEDGLYKSFEDVMFEFLVGVSALDLLAKEAFRLSVLKLIASEIIPFD